MLYNGKCDSLRMGIKHVHEQTGGAPISRTCFKHYTSVCDQLQISLGPARDRFGRCSVYKLLSNNSESVPNDGNLSLQLCAIEAKSIANHFPPWICCELTAHMHDNVSANLFQAVEAMRCCWLAAFLLVGIGGDGQHSIAIALACTTWVFIMASYSIFRPP